MYLSCVGAGKHVLWGMRRGKELVEIGSLLLLRGFQVIKVVVVVNKHPGPLSHLSRPAFSESLL